jgi:hypothetical protein
VFSVSQISTFEFPLTTLQVGFNHVGFLIGVWALIRFSGQWKAIALVIGGGILASWSWACGVLTWPVFLLGMLLLNYRKLSHYLACLGAGAIAAWPYLYYGILHPVTDLYFTVTQRTPGEKFSFVSLCNVPFITRAIGWPFVRSSPRRSPSPMGGGERPFAFQRYCFSFCGGIRKFSKIRREP